MEAELRRRVRDRKYGFDLTQQGLTYVSPSDRAEWKAFHVAFNEQAHWEALATLRDIYIVRNDWRRLTAVLRRLAAVEPENARHHHELADLHCKLGDVRSVRAHLSVALDRLPEGVDRRLVQRNLRTLERAIVALN